MELSNLLDFMVDFLVLLDFSMPDWVKIVGALLPFGVWFYFDIYELKSLFYSIAEMTLLISFVLIILLRGEIIYDDILAL